MADHDHAHHSHMAGEALRTALVLTVAIMIVEAVAGYFANSLALMSDAGHIFTDAVALGLAWFATRLSTLPPSPSNTFGYRRSGILAALANAGVLMLVAVAVLIEAIMRLRHPEPVQGAIVIVGALGAILVNSYIAFALRGAGDHNLNIRAALLHVMGDLAASAGVVVAGLAVVLWHAYVVDPLLSLAIGLLVAYGAWQIVRDTVAILMEATPKGIDLERVEMAMKEVPGVEDVHDLHVWSLSDGFRLLSAHVTVPEQSLSDVSNLLADVKAVLHRRFNIDHATIEAECVDCRVPQRRIIQFHQPAETSDRSG